MNDFLDAGEALEPGRVHAAVVADEPDGGALRTRHRSRLIAHLLDDGNDLLHFVGCGAMAHHNEHDYFPPMVNRSPSRAAVTGPLKRVPASRAGSEVSTGG